MRERMPATGAASAASAVARRALRRRQQICLFARLNAEASVHQTLRMYIIKGNLLWLKPEIPQTARPQNRHQRAHRRATSHRTENTALQPQTHCQQTHCHRHTVPTAKSLPGIPKGSLICAPQAALFWPWLSPPAWGGVSSRNLPTCSKMSDPAAGTALGSRCL